MRPSREEMQQEALERIVNGRTLSNWPAIFAGFMGKGIPESEIKPRENVLTYHAWRALGRQVGRGEHGVKVCTFVACEGKRDANEPAGDETEPNKAKRGYCRPWTATVFHISQTDPIADPATAQRTSFRHRSPHCDRDATIDTFDRAYEDRCREACGL